MKFELYSIGITCASVCTNLPIVEAEQQLNAQYPTGITSPWRFSKAEFFAGNTIRNGCDCPDRPGNKHYLFNC